MFSWKNTGLLCSINCTSFFIMWFPRHHFMLWKIVGQIMMIFWFSVYQVRMNRISMILVGVIWLKLNFRISAPIFFNFKNILAPSVFLRLSHLGFSLIDAPYHDVLSLVESDIPLRYFKMSNIHGPVPCGKFPTMVLGEFIPMPPLPLRPILPLCTLGKIYRLTREMF